MNEAIAHFENNGVPVHRFGEVAFTVNEFNGAVSWCSDWTKLPSCTDVATRPNDFPGFFVIAGPCRQSVWTAANVGFAA